MIPLAVVAAIMLLVAWVAWLLYREEMTTKQLAHALERAKHQEVVDQANHVRWLETRRLELNADLPEAARIAVIEADRARAAADRARTEADLARARRY